MTVYETNIANDGPEALEWLGRTPPPEGVTWEEYLYEPAEVARLVRELYALGSPRVYVPRDLIRRREGSPEGAYALGVHLPPTAEARWAALDLLAERTGAAGRMLPSCARKYADLGGIVFVAYVS